MFSFKLADRVRESSTSTGTGDFSLDGAVFGFQSFGSVLSDGQYTFYAILAGVNWEGGYGRYDASADALVRVSVLGSSNSNNPVNFPAGQKQVEIGLPASIMESLVKANSASGTRPAYLQPNQEWIDTSVSGAPLKKAYVAGDFTVSIASPAVFSKTAHGFMPGQEIKLATTGALPSGLSAGTSYYVLSAGYTADTFRVSATKNGSAVNTTGSQSGTHTLHADVSIGRLVAGGYSGMVGESKEWNADTPLPADGTWLWEDGSNISRTTYADYFAICGTTHGTGDGSTTVGIPDSRGCVTANQDGSANRLVTGLTGGVDGDTVGARGGQDRHTPIEAEMFAHGHAITDPTHSHTYEHDLYGGTVNSGVAFSVATSPSNVSTTAQGTGISVNSRGSSSAFNVVQPTIIKKKIIKVAW